MRGWLVAVAIAALLSLSVAVAATGEELFLQNCSGCHQADARGIPGTFPPLAGNPRVQDTAYVTQTIREGRSGVIEVQGQQFDGVMPPFPNLTDEEVAALVDYLQNVVNAEEGAAVAGAAAGETSPSSAGVVGDPQRGRELFMGRLRFQRGGAPCVACHSAGRMGVLGGGSMGRGTVSAQGNLTVAQQKYGEEGLLGVLAAPPFRVMRTIYRDRPLTDEEKADLVAFLADVANAEEQVVGAGVFTWRMWLVGAAGAIVLFAFMSLGWGRQRQSFAERLRRKP